MAEKSESEKFPAYEFSKLDIQQDNNAVEPIKPSGIRKWLAKNRMLLVTMSGVFLGVFEGLCLRPFEPTKETIMLIAYPGELFMRMMKMMMLPLMISSMIAGTSSLNVKSNGRIALRTFVYFISTTFINAVYGVVLALIIHPGSDGHRHNVGKAAKSSGLLDSMLDLGRNLIPENLFQATFEQAYTAHITKALNSSVASVNGAIAQLAAEPEVIRELRYRSGTNSLGLVFFCMIFGMFLGTIGPKGKVITDFFSALFEVSMKMLSTCILWLTPIGISSVIASKILGIQDVEVIVSQLFWFVLTVAIGIFSYQWIGMQLIYFFFIGKNPYKFYFGLLQPALTAFATSSSAATLPVTFQAVEKLGVDSRIARFVLPLGTGLNMDGTAVFMAISTIFITQMNGMVLEFGDLITVMITVSLLCMCGASIPSGSLLLILVVLQAIGCPVEDVTLLFVIDWLLDRIRTTNNILSDCYCATIVEHLSKTELIALDAEIEHNEQNAKVPPRERRCGQTTAVVVEVLHPDSEVAK